jgi:hypothetical protein
MFKDVSAWLVLIAQDAYTYTPTYATNSIEFAHNAQNQYSTIQSDWGTHIQMGGGGGTLESTMRNVHFHHNTGFGPAHDGTAPMMIYIASGLPEGAFRDIHIYGNVMAIPDAPAKEVACFGYIDYFYSDANGKANWTTRAIGDRTDSEWYNNVVSNINSVKAILTDTVCASLAALDVDATTCRPGVSSPVLTADFDGGICGADIDLIDAATATAELGL